MTGAPIPSEQTQSFPLRLVYQWPSSHVKSTIKTPFIRKCGENIRQDEVGLKKGTYLTPQAISMCGQWACDHTCHSAIENRVISTGENSNLQVQNLLMGKSMNQIHMEFLDL